MSNNVIEGTRTMPTTHKPPIQRLDRQYSLRETVTEQRRIANTSGDLAEDELHSAPSLGEAFGVSATPVREAMMDLVREGLVETVKNKGFLITGMTDKDLTDITEIRLLVEPAASRKAAAAITAGDLPGLRRLADAIVTAADAHDAEVVVGSTVVKPTSLKSSGAAMTQPQSSGGESTDF